MNTPYQLVSLADMFNLPIGKLLKSYGHIATFAQASGFSIVRQEGMTFPKADFDAIVKSVEDFLDSCHEIGFSVSESAATTLRDELGKAPQSGGMVSLGPGTLHKINGEARSVQNCLRHESKLKVALIIPPEKEKYFDPKSPVFGFDVQTKFPAAKYDIDEAAKCLALGRSTAVVFHLMRTLEAALRAIHHCLGIQVAMTGNDKNWGNILNRIKDEIARRGKPWAVRDYFQEIYARLDAIKDAWRNSTMHVESIYTEQEAQLLFDDTRALMEKISSRMDETGIPLA